HYRKIFQQPGALQFSDLLLARSVGNNSQQLSLEFSQARFCILEGPGLWFILTDKNAVSLMRLGVAQLRRAENVAHTFAPLFPDRYLSAAKPVEVLVQDLFVFRGKILAAE